MNLDLEIRAGTCHARVVGEMTIYSAAGLKDGLTALLDAHDTIELDLVGVNEIDTAGAQLLIAMKRTAVQRGKTVLFRYQDGVVRDVFDLFGLSFHFECGIDLLPGASNPLSSR